MDELLMQDAILDRLVSQSACLRECSASIQCEVQACRSYHRSSRSSVIEGVGFVLTGVVSFAAGAVRGVASLFRGVASLLSCNKNRPVSDTCRQVEVLRDANRAVPVNTASGNNRLPARHASPSMPEKADNRELKEAHRPMRPGMAQLAELLCLSMSNGSFCLSTDLQAMLGVSSKTVAIWAAQWSARHPSTQTLATALVVAYLRKYFPKEKETWGLVSEKATAWLRSQQHDWQSKSIQDVEALITTAATWLPTFGYV